MCVCVCVCVYTRIHQYRNTERIRYLDKFCHMIILWIKVNVESVKDHTFVFVISLE